MAWARIHDGAMSNPKVQGLIDWRNPFCVWVWGLSYCQLQLTDGLVHRGAIPNKTAARTAERLVTARLWAPHPDGFLVHDYLDWNDSRAQVLKKRKEAKDRMTNARRRSREHTENVRGTFSREVLRGVDLSTNVPETNTDPGLRERSREVRANTDRRLLLEPVESIRWFDRIYGAYPNKERKQAANEQWVLLAPDLATAQAILADIQRRMQAGWVKLERRFIPHLTRFLEERQWEDAPDVGPIYEEDDGPFAWSCAKCGQIHEGTKAQNDQRVCLNGAGLEG